MSDRGYLGDEHSGVDADGGIANRSELGRESADSSNRSNPFGNTNYSFSASKHPINEIIPLTEEEKAALSEFGNFADEQPEKQIPEYNLADQILAAQRNMTSLKRKGPGDKRGEERVVQEIIEIPAKRKSSANYPRFFEGNFSKVLCDIVSKDIVRFSREVYNEWGNTFEACPGLLWKAGILKD